MESRIVQDQITKVTKGGNQPLLNLGDVKKLRIPVPPREEQKDLVKRICACTRVLEAGEEEAVRLNRVKQGLASDLLSGRVRVKAPQ